MNSWLGNIEIRNIKSIRTQTYFDNSGVEHYEIELENKDGDVFRIVAKLDAKESSK